MRNGNHPVATDEQNERQARFQDRQIRAEARTPEGWVRREILKIQQRAERNAEDWRNRAEAAERIIDAML